MAQAIKVFVPNGKGGYDFHRDVLDQIFEAVASEKRQIVSISIAGAMRTGKSFMLNFLLRYLKSKYSCHPVSDWLGGKDVPLEGFEWREDLNAVTVGILLWSEVFLYDDLSNGEKYAIILMDP